MGVVRNVGLHARTGCRAIDTGVLEDLGAGKGALLPLP